MVVLTCPRSLRDFQEAMEAKKRLGRPIRCIALVDVLVNMRSALLEVFLEAVSDCQRQSPQSWGRGSAPDVLSTAFRLVVLSQKPTVDMFDHACQS